MTLNWGNFPNSSNNNIQPVMWRDDVVFSSLSDLSFLPHGQGRSYGDSCLNEGGILLDTKNLHHFLSFDPKKGILRCEAGVTLADILSLITPYGWILPVLPGTKFVSVGGAIANDIHGKNHHQAGTFGCHVTQFELLRSNGERIICSPHENSDFFAATIGGLGLTGLILWAELNLKPITSCFLSVETIPFQGVEEFLLIAKQAEENYTYTVAWLDCQAKGRKFARGLFMCANHANADTKLKISHQEKKIKIPFYFPAFALNQFTISAFNELYYQLGKRKSSSLKYYDNYFFPLDSLLEWNKIYGKKGFLQYQFVLPKGNEKNLQNMLTKITASGFGSFLSVLKTFGNVQSPGLLSFPMEGVTLALDFSHRSSLFGLLKELDKMVEEAGGKVYPAKDARMSAQVFKSYYPRHQEFLQFVDPKFSSSFWRRVIQRVSASDD
jgi:FAD/FMN-containing dehydrogenase